MQPIKTAILSFGMSGRVFHAPFLQVHKGFEFYAVWERTKNEAEKLYPGVKLYRELDELLKDDEVELVIVNTPTYTHYEYAKKALQAGKHVVVEKSFTTTVAEAEELTTLAEEKGKVLSPFQNRRWDSDFLTVEKVAQEGLLGEIVEAEFHFDRFNESLSPKQHKETPGPGAGILYDLGPHVIDQALHLFGFPGAVFADIRILRPASQVDDYFELLLYYPKLRVRLHASYFVKEALPSFILHGTKGSFVKSRADIQEAELQKGKTPDTTDWGKEDEKEKGVLNVLKEGVDVREHLPTIQGNYLHYFEGIYTAIRENSKPPVTAKDGLNTTRVIEAAFQSSKEQKVIPLK